MEENVWKVLADVEMKGLEDMRLWGLGSDLVRSSRMDRSLGRACIGAQEVRSMRSCRLECWCRTLLEVGCRFTAIKRFRYMINSEVQVRSRSSLV